MGFWPISSLFSSDESSAESADESTGDNHSKADSVLSTYESAALNQRRGTEHVREKRGTGSTVSAAAKKRICDEIMEMFRTALEKDFDGFSCAHAAADKGKSSQLSQKEAYAQVISTARTFARVEKSKGSPAKYAHRMIAAYCERLTHDGRPEVSTNTGTVRQGDTPIDFRSIVPDILRRRTVTLDQAAGISKANEIRDHCMKARTNALQIQKYRAAGTPVADRMPTGTGEWLLLVAEDSRDEAIRARNRVVLDDMTSPKAMKRMLDGWGRVPGNDMALEAAAWRVEEDQALFGPSPLWDQADSSGYTTMCRRLAHAAISEIGRQERDQAGKPAASALQRVADLCNRTADYNQKRDLERLNEWRKSKASLEHG